MVRGSYADREYVYRLCEEGMSSAEVLHEYPHLYRTIRRWQTDPEAHERARRVRMERARLPWRVEHHAELWAAWILGHPIPPPYVNLGPDDLPEPRLERSLYGH